MTVKYGKGAKAKATKLCSAIVRARGECQRCGKTGVPGDFHAAHIIRRNYATTRAKPDNHWCLCPTCHWTVDNHVDEASELIKLTIGWERYYQLKGMALAGVGHKIDWQKTLDNLTKLWKNLEHGGKTNTRPGSVEGG